MNDRHLAWLLPAVAGAVVTVAVVALLHLVVDEPDALPRTSVEPAAVSPTPTSSTEDDAPDGGATATFDGLHLRGDGLDMVDFGASEEDAVATLTDVLGPPDEEVDEPCEDQPQRQSHWVRWADLSVRTDGRTFVGYIEGVHFPPGPTAFDFGTLRGLSPGDALDRARKLYGELRLNPDPEGQGGAEIFKVKDPAGTPSISAVVESAGDEQTVASIFAGELC